MWAVICDDKMSLLWVPCLNIQAFQMNLQARKSYVPLSFATLIYLWILNPLSHFAVSG